MANSVEQRDSPPPVEGFFKTTWRQRAYLPGWDFVGAAALTAAALLGVDSRVVESVLPSLLIAEFGLIGAILGVVIAGLAIVVAFLSRDYAKALSRADGGIGDFWPFWFVAVVAAAAVVAAGAGLIVAEQAPCLRRAVFGVTTFLSAYAVFATVNLVAYVAQQGVTRVWQITHAPDSDDS